MGPKRRPTRKPSENSFAALHSPGRREVSVILERLDLSTLVCPAVRTSTPLKRSAKGRRGPTRHLDFFESESASDEQEPNAKRLKLRKAQHDSSCRVPVVRVIPLTLTAKSGVAPARRNDESSADAAKASSSSSSEDDGSSYCCPTTTETKSTETGSDWEEFTCDGTSSTSAESIRRPSRRSSAKLKQSVKGETSGIRRLQGLGLRGTGSEPHRVRAKAGGQKHPRRPSPGKRTSDSDDEEIEVVPQERDTGRSIQKAASKAKQRACAPGAKKTARISKTEKQGSDSSWESCSEESTESEVLPTHSRSKRNWLRGPEQKKQTSRFTSSRETRGSCVAKSEKVITARKQPTHQLCSDDSDVDLERPQKEDTARSGKVKLLAKQKSADGNGSQHATKKSQAVGSKRRRERGSDSHSSEGWLPTPSESYDSFLSATEHVRKKSHAGARSGYAARRRSIRVRREDILSSKYSSSSSDDSEDEPGHLQKDSMSKSREPYILGKQQVVDAEGSCIRLARKYTNALLSKRESASRNSSKRLSPLRSRQPESEEHEDSSRNVWSKPRSPVQRKPSRDFLAARARGSRAVKDSHVGAKGKDAPLSGSSSLLDDDSDKVEDTQKNDCARLGRTTEQHGRDNSSIEERTTLDSESEEPTIPVRRRLPRTGAVPTGLKRNCTTGAGTTAVGREDKVSYDCTTSSEGSSSAIPYSLSNATRPQSGRSATRNQPKLKAATVEGKKESGSRSLLMARRHGGTSQDSSDGSRGFRKKGIARHTEEAVARKQPGRKGNRAQQVMPVKIIERKQHPSSGSNCSAEEGITAESEDSKVSSSDTSSEPAASTERSSKFRLNATKGTGTRVTRRSLMGAGRDYSLAPGKQQQLETVVIQANNGLRSSLTSTGRKATSSSIISTTVDNGSGGLKRSQKNEVAQSKAILNKHRGRKENHAHLEANASARKRPVSECSSSSTEELLTSELESEESRAGQKALRSQPMTSTQGPLQHRTDATNVRKSKSVAGDSSLPAKGNDKFFRDSSSMAEVSSDSSGHSQRNATTQSQLGNPPARIRLQRRTATQAKKERATRSSPLVTSGMSSSGLSSSLKSSDDHSEHSWKKIAAQPSTKPSRGKTSVQPGKAGSKAVASKGSHGTKEASQSKKQTLRTVTRSRTSSYSPQKPGARPKRAVQRNSLQQAGSRVAQGAEGPVTRGQLNKASSESDEDIEQFRSGTPTPIAKTNVAKKDTANQVTFASGRNEAELDRMSKRSKSVAPKKVGPTTSKEPRKAQIDATMLPQSGSTVEEEQLQSIQNSSAAGDHSGPVKATRKNVPAHSEEGSKRIITRSSRSTDKNQAPPTGIAEIQTKGSEKILSRSSRQKKSLLHETDFNQGKKRSTAGEHAMVMKVFPCKPPNTVCSSNRFKHLQGSRTCASDGNTVKRNLGAGPSCNLLEKAAKGRFTINNQQGGIKKTGGSSSADKSADLQVEEEMEEASKVAGQATPSTILSKQHNTYAKMGTSASKGGKSVVEVVRKQQAPLKLKSRQSSVMDKASEQPCLVTRPKRKCTMGGGGNAPAPQKQVRAATKKQGTQTAAKNFAKKLPDMGGASTSSVDRSRTDSKTKDSTKRKENGAISTKLKEQDTSEEKAAQLLEVDQVTRSNSATSPREISKTSHGRGCSVSQQENAATPSNRRKRRALKERIGKPLAVNEPVIRCSPIIKPRKQHETAAEGRNTAPGVPPTTLSGGKRTAVRRQKQAVPLQGKSKLPLGTAITAGKGTLKRKRQIRKMTEALAAAAALSDDIYGSSSLPHTGAIPDLLFRESAEESVEDSLMVAGMRTPQLGSVAGSPWKKCVSPGVSLCSASSSPLRASEEIAHAIQKQVRASRRPSATSTPKVKLKSRKATKNILVDLIELEDQLQTIQDKENHLGCSDVELDYFSEDSSAL